MFPNLDPKKMQAMMKQLGMKQEDIPASRVIIEQEDKNIIIENPSVVKMTIQGQDTFLISGDISQEASESDTKEADIKTVIEKTGKSREECEKALKQADGDLAEAILSLSN